MTARDSVARALPSREVIVFGIVGVINLVIDVGLFNVLLSAGTGPLTSKAVATFVAATSSYFMNRHWTWKDRARTGLAREYRMFILLSVIALGITEGCLAISHYVLGFTSVLADNIAANGVGLGLAMVFRFWSFRKFVFLDPDEHRNLHAAEEMLSTSN